MAELIIGHTTHDSALLWVRGDRRFSHAKITLKPQPRGKAISSDPLTLRPEQDFTGVASFKGKLEPDKSYRVLAEFAPSREALTRPSVAQAGSLHTFPEPGSGATRFSFLVGSCNLPTARITSLGATLAGAIGTVAMSRSVQRDPSTWVWPRPEREASKPEQWHAKLKRLLWRVVETFPGILKWGATKGAWILWAAVLQATRFQQPKPRLTSPFGPLLECLHGEAAECAAFMIHAGDQIYFDTDAPSRPAEVEEYRRAYRQAWFEDEFVRSFLASCPHYMMLDDHEIIDGFANQPESLKYLAPAKRAYREYVHCRQPRQSENALYYQFDYDQTRFFVLDARTERFPERGQMISPDQLACLEGWLRENRNRLKFVISSIPFVAHLRPPESAGGGADKDESSDKWCGRAFRAQRDGIIDFIHRNEIQRVIFLVGDMHCIYHSTMRVGPPDKRLAIHELAAGPINQVQFTRREKFYDHYRGTTLDGTAFSSLLRSFHGSTAAAVHVTVDNEVSPMVRWRVVPTSRPTRHDGYQPPPLGGQISFRN